MGPYRGDQITLWYTWCEQIQLRCASSQSSLRPAPADQRRHRPVSPYLLIRLREMSYCLAIGFCSLLLGKALRLLVHGDIEAEGAYVQLSHMQEV